MRNNESTITAPLVSVLMTSYNREQYIAEAIESVLKSSYVNFELIIVDDDSADKTFIIARRFAELDYRIRVYKNGKNLGDYPNRNSAATYAKGKYLKFVDSDDRIYPNTLEEMVELMERNPKAGFGLCDSSSNQEDHFPGLFTARESYCCHYFQRPIFFASPGQAIFRKSAFDAVGGFPEKRMVGDFEMWHKMTLRFPLLLLPPNLYWVRHHDGQEVAQQNKYILEYEKIKIQYLFSADSPLLKKEACEIVQKRKQTVLKIFVRKLTSLEFAEAAVRFKVYWFYLKRRLSL